MVKEYKWLQVNKKFSYQLKNKCKSGQQTDNIFNLTD